MKQEESVTSVTSVTSVLAERTAARKRVSKLEGDKLKGLRALDAIEVELVEANRELARADFAVRQSGHDNEIPPPPPPFEQWMETAKATCPDWTQAALTQTVGRFLSGLSAPNIGMNAVSPLESVGHVTGEAVRDMSETHYKLEGPKRELVKKYSDAPFGEASDYEREEAAKKLTSSRPVVEKHKIALPK